MVACRAPRSAASLAFSSCAVMPSRAWVRAVRCRAAAALLRRAWRRWRTCRRHGWRHSAQRRVLAIWRHSCLSCSLIHMLLSRSLSSLWILLDLCCCSYSPASAAFAFLPCLLCPSACNSPHAWTWFLHSLCAMPAAHLYLHAFLPATASCLCAWFHMHSVTTCLLVHASSLPPAICHPIYPACHMPPLHVPPGFCLVPCLLPSSAGMAPHAAVTIQPQPRPFCLQRCAPRMPVRAMRLCLLPARIISPNHTTFLP